MENKGTGRVCLRALPFLMAFLTLSLRHPNHNSNQS